MKNDIETNTPYSPRSQRGFLREFQLREEAQRIEGEKDRHQREIADLEDVKKRHLEATAKGETFHPNILLVFRDLEDRTRAVAAHETQLTGIRSEIDKACQPTPAQLTERRERQTYLAQVVAHRGKKTDQVEAALQALRHLLQERAELTQKMHEIGRAIELSTPDLDADRYDELQNSLPETLAPESTRWIAWFLGTRENLRRYRVRDEVLVLPETLAHSGVYFFGDKIELTQEEAQELLRSDHPAPSENAPWRFAAPSIMTPEDFEATVAEAKKKGIGPEGILLWKDAEADAKTQARWKEEYWPTSQYPRKEASRTPITVRARTTRVILAGGREYRPGEILELKSRQEFWSLVDSEAITPA